MTKIKRHALSLLVAAAFGGRSGHHATPARCLMYSLRVGDPITQFALLSMASSSGSKKRAPSQRQRRKARRAAHAAGKRHAFA